MSEGNLGRLLALAGPERKRFGLACLYAAAGTALAILPFLLAARMVIEPSTATVGMLAACLLLQPVLMGTATAVAHDAAFDVLHAIRRDLAEKMTRLPLGHFTRRQVGALKRLLNEDVEVLELFLSHQLPDMTACLLVPLLTLIAVGMAEWRLALAALGIVPLAYGAQVVMMRGHGVKMAEFFGRIGAINGTAVEYVRGIEVVKGVRGGTLITEEMNRKIEEFRLFAEGWFRLWGPPWSIYAVAAGASAVFVVPTALWPAANGEASPSSLVFGLFAATAIGARAGQADHLRRDHHAGSAGGAENPRRPCLGGTAGDRPDRPDPDPGCHDVRGGSRVPIRQNHHRGRLVFHSRRWSDRGGRAVRRRKEYVAAADAALRRPRPGMRPPRRNGFAHPFPRRGRPSRRPGLAGHFPVRRHRRRQYSHRQGRRLGRRGGGRRPYGHVRRFYPCPASRLPDTPGRERHAPERRPASTPVPGTRPGGRSGHPAAGRGFPPLSIPGTRRRCNEPSAGWSGARPWWWCRTAWTAPPEPIT